MSEITVVAFAFQIIALIAAYVLLSLDEDDQIFGREHRPRNKKPQGLNSAEV